MVKLTLMGIEDQRRGEVVYVNPIAVSHIKPYPHSDSGGCYVHLHGAEDGYGFWCMDSAGQVLRAIEEDKRSWQPISEFAQVTVDQNGSMTITVPQEEA